MVAEHGRLVLVLSPERSGSTLLATMLGAHTRVIAPPELFLLRYPDFDTWRREKRAAFASFSWLMERLGEPSDSRTIDERFRGLATPEVVRWILRRLGAGRILVDKTPAYARDRGTLERAESLAPHYVWLRRHPLGVANSWIERRRARRWRTLGRLGTAAAARLARAHGAFGRWLNHRLDDRAVDAALTRWRLTNEMIMDFVANIPAERVSEIEYEDLLRAPEPTLNAIATRLGIACEPAMLEPWKHLPSALAAGIGDERIRSHTAIETARADSWRDRLDESRLDSRTRALLAKLARRDGT
jgi:LPS sulfotransferase NodH